ncbi:MAG: caspase family protein [Rhizobiaceae bacterium]|nr:caspase family protein [Rhizobiaceae bacterium]
MNRVWAALFACALAFSWPALAEDPLRGVALVIGNGDYAELPDLPNPANDADAVEALLADLGFDSVRRTDRDAASLRRDLDRFVEDAADADVAILYYSGHGIEAGGENYLVPVDAGLSALGDAGARLVPLSALVERLQATVPVTILMLDACRDNPFPPGTSLTLAAGEAPAAITASGLAATRGAAALGSLSSASAADTFGTVLAFAAEPGKAALDGPAGGNSPYAAAIVRHLDAMAGEEFGTVLRMVGEEVYLKTGGRQRPWVNESLRRLLYFGSAPAAATGEEGDILAERRRLLVTIAALPDPERRQVERAAANAGVPMDALYGMLRTLGADTPRDPVALDSLLREQTERLKALLGERAALKSKDPEIARLSALADTAIAEGALETAIALHARAKARVGELEATVAQAEDDIRARRIEFAEVFARSAKSYELAFRNLDAAADYARAFDHVERWDPALAVGYRLDEMNALIQEGDYRGDRAALERALAAGEQVLALALVSGNRRDWASGQSGISNALGILGRFDNDVGLLSRSVEAARLSLAEYDRKAAPDKWAKAQASLGYALWTLGEHGADPKPLEEAVAAFNLALEEQTREAAPADWANTQNSLGNVLWTLGNLGDNADILYRATDAFLAVLDELTPEKQPLDWAMAQTNLGNAYWALSMRTTGVIDPRQAVDAYRLALTVFKRESTPTLWSATQNNLAYALTAVGEREEGAASLLEAIATARLALQERPRETQPRNWAGTQSVMARALMLLGQREDGTARLEESVAAYRSALEEVNAETSPLGWATLQSELGQALVALGSREMSREHIEEGRAAFVTARDMHDAYGQADYDRYFNDLIAKADAALAGLE